MKRKFLIVILAIVAAISCGLGLIACTVGYTNSNGGTHLNSASKTDSVVPASDSGDVVTVSSDTQPTIGFASLPDAASYVNSNAVDDNALTVTLLQPITVNSTVSFGNSNKRITATLDLNGYVLKMTGADRVISLTNANFTLKDSNQDNENNQGTGTFTYNDVTYTGGVITGGNAFQGGAIYVNYSSLEMLGGTLVGNEVTGNGGAIFTTGFVDESGSVKIDSTVILSGGTISDNKSNATSDASADGNGGGVYVSSNSTCTITGDVVITKNETQRGGGGVYVNSGATLNMTGGAIKENLTGASGCGGGLYVNGVCNISDGSVDHNRANRGAGVFVNGGSSLEMSGGTISDNITNVAGSSMHGGGIFCAEDSKTSLSGGTICKNVASNSGGGLYVTARAVCEISGTASITQNTAYGYGTLCGGGLYVNDKGTLKMTGGSITENIAGRNDGSGGGLYVYGTFELSGNPEISGNTRANGTANNVQLREWEWEGATGCSPITITGKLSNTTPIGIYITHVRHKFTSGYTASGNTATDEALNTYFESDTGSKLIYLEDNEGAIGDPVAEVVLDGDETNKVPYARFNDAWSAATTYARQGKEVTLKLLDDVTVTSRIGLSIGSHEVAGKYVFYSITLDLNSKTLKNIADNHLFQIESGELIVIDDSVEKTGRLESSASDKQANGIFIVNNGGSCTIKGGTIQATGYGVTSQYGTVNIEGGTIEGSGSSATGGGIYLQGASLHVRGGQIINNNFYGVLCAYNSTVNLTGGIISGNKYCITVYSGGTINVSGDPIVRDNTLGNISQGVIVSGPLEEGAEIHYSGAGGVITSGYKTNNGNTDPNNFFKADVAGKFVYLNADGEVVIGDGVAQVITTSETKNFVSIYEAWTYAFNYSPATVKLLDNVTLTSGILAEIAANKDITLNLNGHTLDLNATGHLVVNGKLTIDDSGTGGTIKKGYADNGGALMIYGTVVMNNGTITENTAKGGYTYGGGGGVFVNQNGKFTMNGGTITGNKIENYSADTHTGVGVYVDRSAELFQMGGNAVISGNTLNDETTANNLFLAINAKITIDKTAPLTAGPNIGVSLQTGHSGVITSGYYDANGNDDPKKYFVSEVADKSMYLNYFGEVVIGDGVAQVTRTDKTGETLKFVTLAEAVEYVNTHAGTTEADGLTLTLLDSINVSSTVTLGLASGSNLYVTFDLNGYVLQMTGTGRVITAQQVYLTIKDSRNTNVDNLGAGNTFTYKGNTYTGGVITGGSITTGSTTSAATRGAGIYVNGGTLTLQSGSIVGNSTIGYGGGIYADSSITISGGAIERNSAASGGGVYSTSDLTMTGGKINYNSSTSGASAVELTKLNVFTMSGGEICYNTSTNAPSYFSGNNLGGYAVKTQGQASISTVVLSGNPIIRDNTAGGVPANLLAAKRAESTSVTLITVNKLTDGADIHVTNFLYNYTTKNPEEYGVFTTGYSANNPGVLPAKYFTYDDPDKVVYLENGEVAVGTPVAKVTFNGKDTFYGKIGEAFTYANSCGTTASKTAVITLLKSVTTTEGLSVIKHIELNLNGYNITYDKTSANNQSSVIITSMYLHIYGDGVISGGFADKGGGVCVTAGTFKMSGGTISGNTADYGAGVYVAAGYITFEMTGGKIINNQSRDNDTHGHGGGVHVMQNATFKMSGGEISGNSVSVLGGGVYVVNYGKILLSGNPVIKGNTANGATNNLCLDNSFNHANITIAGALTSTEPSIGVTIYSLHDGNENSTQRTASDKFTSYYSTYHNTTAPATYFFGDSGECLWLDNNEAVIGHQPGAKVEAKDVTCTEDGLAEHYTCGLCEKHFSDEYCKSKLAEVVITKLGHSMNTVAEEAATCTEVGYREHLYCDRCEKWFTNDTEQEEKEESYFKIDAKGHDYKYKTTVEATCDEDGEREVTCSRCDYKATETIPAHHTLTHVDAVAPTCIKDGNFEHWHCTACEKNFEDGQANIELGNIVDGATGHNYGAPVWSWADDYSSATAEFTCTNDGCGDKQTKTATITSIEVSASCDEDGSITYTATVKFNNTDYTDEQVKTLDALGHDWTANWGEWEKAGDGWTISVSFTCEKTLPAHTENPTNVVIAHSTTTAETCGADGVETWTASIVFDGATYNAPDKEVVRLATGNHVYPSEKDIDVAPTCTTEGSKSYHCTVCGAKDESSVEAVAAIGHKWQATVDDSKMMKAYYAFGYASLRGLNITFVCENDETHTHTFNGNNDTATVGYENGDCFRYGDTSITVTVPNYGTVTINGITVEKQQVAAGGGKWLIDNTELMSGYIDTDSYKCYPSAVDDATQVTNAVVRFVDGKTFTVTYPDGEMYTVSYTGARTANDKGVYTVTAILTLNDPDNYEFYAEEGSTLNADGTLSVVKIWYVAVCDNGFTSEIEGWTFGDTTTPHTLPALEKDDGQNETVMLVLNRVVNGKDEKIGEFNRSQYNNYLTYNTPAGSYKLVATVGNVTVEGIEYSGFTHTFTFSIEKADLTVSNKDDLKDITETYDGKLHIVKDFTPEATLYPNRNGIWWKPEYDGLFSAAASITYSCAGLNGTYYTASEIENKLTDGSFCNVGTYTLQYKISANNYKDVTGSITVTINKATYTLNVTFDGDTVTYDGEPHSLAISGKLPDGVEVEYSNNGKTNAGTYVVTARFKGDYDNYEAIENMTATLAIEKVAVTVTVDLKGDTVGYDGKPHSLAIEGTLPKQVGVAYTGNNKSELGEHTVTATLNIKDEYKANYEFAEGTKTNYSAILKIVEGKLNIEVKFGDKTVTYTGNTYSLAISGKLPAGVTYSYENNGQTEVGEYDVIVHFHHNLAGYDPIEDMSAKLVIEQASYDFSNVTLPNLTVVYSGNPHSLAIRGKLPAGVSCNYVNNSRTNVGSQTVTVKFLGDTKNYVNGSYEMTATLQVVPASLSGGSLSLESKTVTYNGNTHRLAVGGNIPEGVNVKYYVVIDGEEVEFNGARAVGTYDIVAKFELPDSENYRAIRQLSARLTILEPVQVETPPDVEPSVDVEELPVAGNYDAPVAAVMGGTPSGDFPWWIIIVCIIGVEVIAMAGMGYYIAFRSHKKKKR